MNTLAIYIHWPFCAALCPYCDFNVHIKRDISDKDFIAGISAELSLLVENIGARLITSVFFGGGTPSLMPPALIADCLAQIKKTFTMDQNAEITLEANPEDADKKLLSDFCTAGINRLSLGVQSLDDDALRFLGRKHDARAARQAIEYAQEIFPETSFDLIAARPKQDETSWRQELTQALSLAPKHLSIYQLTCPEGTRFARALRHNRFALPEDDLAALLYQLTDDLCQDHGLARYEISNHARPGHEARHNLSYWLYHDYAGLGPGAHGRLCLKPDQGEYGEPFVATATPRTPQAWFVSASKNDFARHYQARALSAQMRGNEMLMMGLRLAQGLCLERHRAITQHALDQKKIAALCAQGLVQQNHDYLRATPKGALLLDSIIAQLIA